MVMFRPWVQLMGSVWPRSLSMITVHEGMDCRDQGPVHLVISGVCTEQPCRRAYSSPEHRKRTDVKGLRFRLGERIGVLWGVQMDPRYICLAADLSQLARVGHACLRANRANWPLNTGKWLR